MISPYALLQTGELLSKRHALVIYIDEHRYMDGKERLMILKALADPARLDILDLLAREPQGLHAGLIAEALGRRQNTLSSHLSALADAGLVHGERRGRFITYRCERERMLSLASRLTTDFG
jgi:ArsR family transcriptional regulator, arsenate/arsenite/antimonite-responsive transcriptional repressor